MPDRIPEGIAPRSKDELDQVKVPGYGTKDSRDDNGGTPDRTAEILNNG